MRHARPPVILTTFLVLVLAGQVPASEPNFSVVIDVGELELDAAAREDLNRPGWQFPDLPTTGGAHRVRVSLDGPGQVYFRGQPAAAPPSEERPTAALAIRVRERRDLQGTLFIARPDGGEHRVRFAVSADELGEQAGEEYYRILAAHYQPLARASLRGRAWFRSQLHQTQRMLGEEAAQPADPRDRAWAISDTFNLFSGTHAASENLQLDALLEPDEIDLITDVDLAEVEGVTVDPIDWEPLLEGADHQADAMAEHVPHDQLAIFFTDAGALQRALAVFEQQGTQIMRWSVRAEDDRTQQRYEQQLAVSARQLGQIAAQVPVGQITVTAGDPYIMAGTDLALLLESSQPDELRQALVEAQQQAAADAGAEMQTRQIGGIETSVVRTEQRALSSYVALVEDVVILSNSAVQLERIINAAAGQLKSVAALPEYAYFRGRYALDEPETLLLVISDEAIRKWGSPTIRVAASRRARVLAGMLEARARHLGEILSGDMQPRELEMPLAVPDAGALRLGASGVVSSVYGRPEFLTPINELDITHASDAEVEAYEQWRARYEGQWREVFDPIAMRLTIEQNQLTGDLTVLPLSGDSDYREMLAFIGDAQITAERPVYGDGLAHFAMAIDRDSEPMMELRNFARQSVAGVDNPFGWLGEMVGAYVDASDFWRELAEASEPQQFVEDRSYALPIAFYAEVDGRVQLASFLTGLRTLVQSSAPGLVEWVNREHQDRQYVAVISAEEAGVEGMAIYYAIHRGVLLLTLNERTVQRFLESADEDAGGARARPWLAKQVNFQIGSEAVQLLEQTGERDPGFGGALRAQSWRYLPVLNDLRQHFPQHDPVETYKRLSGSRPVDVFGGEFVWSQEDQTMISTAVGHPGNPQEPEQIPMLFDRLDFANLGLSYDPDHDALRGRMVIEQDER